MFGAPRSKHDGVRGPMKASISPASSMALSVLPSGAGSSFTSGGSVIEIFSTRPGCSSPPRIQWMSEGFTPYSSSSSARAHTLAVS